MDAFVLRFPRTGIVNATYHILKHLKRSRECDLTILLQDLQFSEPELEHFARSFKYRLVEETVADQLTRQVRRYAMDRNLAANLPLPHQMTRVVDHCDVYHCTDWYYYPSKRAQKNIITVYDMTAKLFPQHHERTNIIKETRKWRALRDFDTIIAISDSTRNDLINHTGVKPERIITLPLGVDSVYEDPSIVERDYLFDYYRIPRGRRYILSVSTIEPRKNIIGLLDAFQILARSGSTYDDVMLILTGPMGWRNDDLSRYLDEYSYKDRIMFLGYVPLSDMPSLYRHAECFAYLSFYEGFGLPILEAMKSSCPVVCSDTSSMPEVIGDCGEMVSPKHAQQAADAMRRILDQPSYGEELRKKAKARSWKFSWENHVSKLLEIYHS